MKKLQLLVIYLVTVFRRSLTHLKKITLILLLLIGLVSLILFLGRGSELFRPAIHEGLISTYTEKDLPSQVTNLLSSSLVQIDASGSPKLNLAEIGRAHV